MAVSSTEDNRQRTSPLVAKTDTRCCKGPSGVHSFKYRRVCNGSYLKVALSVIVLVFVCSTSSAYNDVCMECTDNTTECPGLCPSGQFYNMSKGGCQICSTCQPPLEAAQNCGTLVPALDPVLGELCVSQNSVCCQPFEYAFNGECILNCDKCEHGSCPVGRPVCECDEGWHGNLCQHQDVVVTTPPTTYSPPTVPPSGEPSLDPWQIVLIAVGIVIGIVIFSALLVIASFCQYARNGRRGGSRFSSNNTVITMSDTQTVLDSRSNSSVTVSSGHSSLPHNYLITPPHTRAFSDLRVPP